MYNIRILEGQKKAQYEECEEERKKNNEKIQTLKRDIKEVYQIKRQESTVSIKQIKKKSLSLTFKVANF